MIKFSEMPYTRPDIEGLRALLTQAKERVERARSFSEVREAYFDVQEKYKEAMTLFSIATPSIPGTSTTTGRSAGCGSRWRA